MVKRVFHDQGKVVANIIVDQTIPEDQDCNNRQKQNCPFVYHRFSLQNHKLKSLINAKPDMRVALGIPHRVRHIQADGNLFQQRADGHAKA